MVNFDNLLRQEIRNNFDKTYVYALYRPCGKVFYVGVGRRYRVFQHGLPSDTSEVNPIKKRIIDKVRKSGEEIGRKILKYFDNRQDALKLEVSLIKYFGRVDNKTGILANLTDGGEGCSGFKSSKESIAKMAASLKGRPLSDNAKKALLERNTYPVMCLNNMIVFESVKVANAWFLKSGVLLKRDDITRSIRIGASVKGLCFTRTIKELGFDVGSNS